MKAEQQHGITTELAVTERKNAILDQLRHTPAFMKHARPLDGPDAPPQDEWLEALSYRVASWDLLFLPGINDRQTDRAVIKRLDRLATELRKALDYAGRLTPEESRSIASRLPDATPKPNLSPDTHETVVGILLVSLVNASNLPDQRRSDRSRIRTGALYSAMRKARADFDGLPQTARGGVSGRLSGRWTGVVPWRVHAEVAAMSAERACVSELIFGVLVAVIDYLSARRSGVADDELAYRNSLGDQGRGGPIPPRIASGERHVYEALFGILLEFCPRVAVSDNRAGALCQLVTELVDILDRAEGGSRSDFGDASGKNIERGLDYFVALHAKKVECGFFTPNALNDQNP